MQWLIPRLEKMSRESPEQDSTAGIRSEDRGQAFERRLQDVLHGSHFPYYWEFRYRLLFRRSESLLKRERLLRQAVASRVDFTIIPRRTFGGSALPSDK